MDYIIREIREDEYEILSDFLYEAIYVPEGVEPLERDIINAPELQIYIRDFGLSPDDACLVAEADGTIVGAVWARIMDDYGHIDDDTPSLAISLLREYRGLGIGTEMLREMLALLKRRGYKGVSLSVQKENRAARLYQRLGFYIVSETDEEYIMRVEL